MPMPRRRRSTTSRSSGRRRSVGWRARSERISSEPTSRWSSTSTATRPPTRRSSCSISPEPSTPTTSTSEIRTPPAPQNAGGVFVPWLEAPPGASGRTRTFTRRAAKASVFLRAQSGQHDVQRKVEIGLDIDRGDLVEERCQCRVLAVRQTFAKGSPVIVVIGRKPAGDLVYGKRFGIGDYQPYRAHRLIVGETRVQKRGVKGLVHSLFGGHPVVIQFVDAKGARMTPGQGAQRPAQGANVILPVAARFGQGHLIQKGLHDFEHERVAVAVMMVERHRVHAHLTGQLAHAESLFPVTVQKDHGGGDDFFA